MLDIALDDRAVARLTTEPEASEWRDGLCGRRVPILRHQHRHTTATADGVVVQRGNFFLLTTIDPRDADEMDGLVLTTAVLPNGRAILIGVDPTVMANTAQIAWLNDMFVRRGGRKRA